LKKHVIAIALIQILLGYEFLISGRDKLAPGSSFTTGLFSYLRNTVGNQPGLYSDFINRFVLPHAIFFGYFIAWTEVAAGLILIIAPIAFFYKGNGKTLIHKTFAVLSVLALVSIFIMCLNFFLTSSPYFLPGQGNPYKEGVSFDFFIGLMSLVLIGWNVAYLKSGTKQDIG
jgi:hypothetical protein